MINTISWNIISVRTLSAFQRLKILKDQHKFISVQEPFIQADQIGFYMEHLDTQGSYANINNKIWLLWINDFNVNIIKDSEQHITCHINHVSTGIIYHASFVYAKCRTVLRKLLWEELGFLSSSIQGPWSISGDFNVIAEVEEKTGGTPYRLDKSFDFINFYGGMQDARCRIRREY